MCGAQAVEGRGVSEGRGEARVVELLMVPVAAFALPDVLKVKAFPRLMALLPPAAYRDMAGSLVRTTLHRGVEVPPSAPPHLRPSLPALPLGDIDASSRGEQAVQKFCMCAHAGEV